MASGSANDGDHILALSLTFPSVVKVAGVGNFFYHGKTEEMSDFSQEKALKRTVLYPLHEKAGAKFVGFCGYEMPIQYPEGILGEHLKTRKSCGFFDVSHMGQACLVGQSYEDVARALEGLVPADLLGLAPGQMRYTQLLTSGGGIIDDLIVTRPREEAYGDRLFLVVNAARKEMDYGWLREGLPTTVRLEPLEDRALIALQGPGAEAVICAHCPGVVEMGFMTSMEAVVRGVSLRISRCGYTGEDGFELSVPRSHALEMGEWLASLPGVHLAGLGARDSLRLEAGLCLYGHDIDETTSPVEAALSWSIGKRRRQEGGFIGQERVLTELKEGVLRKRVGLALEGRLVAREGAEILSAVEGEAIGKVTSGGFAPSLGAPIAMGYVGRAYADIGTDVRVSLRGKAIGAKGVAMPFVPQGYKR